MDDREDLGRAEVILFSPRIELSALENLVGFIALARDELTIFGRDLDWDADAWDVTETTHGSGQGTIRIGFTGWTGKEEPAALLGPSLREFAKAYIRYQQGLNPRKGLQHVLGAFRALDAVSGFNDLQDLRITPLQLDLAAGQIAAHYGAAGAYRIAGRLEEIGRFLSEQALVAVPFQWSHTISRPRELNRLGEEFEKRRAEKLPEQRELEAVAYAFRAADNPSDRIAASAAALMCCAPIRVGELLRIRSNCEVVREDRKGAQCSGLRWWTEKGMKPEVRWIVATMEDVASEAIATIRELTSEARRISAWYEANPKRLYLPENLSWLRDVSTIPFDVADELLGLNSEKWAARNGVRPLGAGLPFEAFEAAVIAMLPRGFPLVETATELRYSEALFAVRHNEFRTDRGTSHCMIDRVSQQQVSDCLGGRIDLPSGPVPMWHLPMFTHRRRGPNSRSSRLRLRTSRSTACASTTSRCCRAHATSIASIATTMSA